MALEVQVSKQSVVQKQQDLYIITLRLQYVETGGEDDVVVFSQDFQQKYRTGDSIADLAQAYQADMQAAINQYNQEQTYYNHVQMDALVTWLNNNLTG